MSLWVTVLLSSAEEAARSARDQVVSTLADASSHFTSINLVHPTLPIGLFWVMVQSSWQVWIGWHGPSIHTAQVALQGNYLSSTVIQGNGNGGAVVN